MVINNNMLYATPSVIHCCLCLANAHKHEQIMVSSIYDLFDYILIYFNILIVL